TCSALSTTYPLSLHDALPISARQHHAFFDDVGRELGRRALETRADCLDDRHHGLAQRLADLFVGDDEGLRDAVHEVAPLDLDGRSEEHTSELQSHLNLVCRLL